MVSEFLSECLWNGTLDQNKLFLMNVDNVFKIISEEQS